MAVDDAELLALAGGDSSDEESPRESTPLPKSTSVIPSIELPQASSRPSTSKARSSPAPKRRESSSKAARRSRRDDSEEEGEASSSPASPNSRQSAPMSESESESSRGDDAASDGHPFPVDNQFHSEKDRKEIMALPEVQRESILAERAQIRERKLQDQHLRRLLQARENAEAKSADRKRKAGADAEDSPRKSSRQKTNLGGRKVGEASEAIKAYKRQREEKGLRDQARRTAGASRRDHRANSSSERRFSSADADGESEPEWDEAKQKAEDKRLRNAQPGDYHDFRRATLTRGFLAEFCFYPKFEEVVRDCYVRIPMKAAPAARENTYHLVPVKSVFEKEGWFYAVTKSNEKKFATNQHLKLVVEGSEVEFHFNSISNSVITEVEVANYKNTLANEGKAVPTHTFLEMKVDELHRLINHSFTDEELQRKLQRSGVLTSRIAPLDRISIANRRRAAEERGDTATVAACDAELAELNGPRLKYGTSLTEPKSQHQLPAQPTQQERLAQLNRLNRKKNAEDVRKAQLAEKRAARLAREAVERGEAVQDPFARVKTYAKTHHDVNESLAPHRAKHPPGGSRDVSRSVTPGLGPGTPKIGPVGIGGGMGTGTSPGGGGKGGMRKGLPILSSRNMDEEIIGGLDMGIDIEI